LSRNYLYINYIFKNMVDDKISDIEEFNLDLIKRMLSDGTHLSLEGKREEAIQVYQRAEDITFIEDLNPLLQRDENFGYRLHDLWTQGAQSIGKKEIQNGLMERAIAMHHIKNEFSVMYGITGQRELEFKNYLDSQSIFRNYYTGFRDQRWLRYPVNRRMELVFRTDLYKLASLFETSQPESALNCLVGLATQIYYACNGLFFSPIFDENIEFYANSSLTPSVGRLRGLIYQRLVDSKRAKENFEKTENLIKNFRKVGSGKNFLGNDNSLNRVYRHFLADENIRTHRMKKIDNHSSESLDDKNWNLKWIRHDSDIECAIRGGLNRAIKEYRFEVESYKQIIKKDCIELEPIIEELKEKLACLNSAGLDSYLDRQDELSREYYEKIYSSY